LLLFFSSLKRYSIMTIIKAQKRTRILILISLLFALVGLTIWLSYTIDRISTSTTNEAERMRIAKALLLKNKAYIFQYAEKIKSTEIPINACDCIIDSLTPRFAAIYALSDLEKLNADTAGCLIQLSALVEENQQVWGDCITRISK
jgi:hypothetical protein